MMQGLLCISVCAVYSLIYGVVSLIPFHREYRGLVLLAHTHLKLKHTVPTTSCVCECLPGPSAYKDMTIRFKSFPVINDFLFCCAIIQSGVSSAENSSSL